MAYDNNKEDRATEYDMNLSIIKGLIDMYKNEKDYVITIGGDFNADTARNKNFDKKLGNFIKINELTSMSNEFSQIINHTYINGTYKATLDHIYM